MFKQHIRKGDKVRFARADEHPSADKRSFFVEEVIPAEGKSEVGVTVPGPGASARIVDIGERSDVPWKLVMVDALKHDGSGDAIEVIVAPGYLGNPDQWCWWEAEYPEDGVFGGYKTRQLVLDDIAQLEARDPTTHYHVVELVETTIEQKLKMSDCDCTVCAYAKKHPQTGARRCWEIRAELLGQLQGEVPAGDVRRRGRSSYPGQSGRERRARRVLAEMSGVGNPRGRRFFRVDFVQRGMDRGETRSLEQLTIKLRITLVGAAEPFQGDRDFLVIERCEIDAASADSWIRMPSGSRIYDMAIYWLIRRLAGIADQHKPLALIGTIHEVAGDINGPHYEFTPSEEQ